MGLVVNRPGNVVGVLIHVETAIDGLWYRLDFGAKIPLDVVKVETIVPVDQVNSQTKMAVPSRAPNPVEIRLGVLGEVKVDDHVDGLDINATGQEIRAYQITAHAIAEVVEDAVSRRLRHLCVAVEA